MDVASLVKESSFESFEGDTERKRIVGSVVDGDLDQAIKETQEHYPAVLEANSGIILFKLRCRKFVEMILATAEMKKGTAQLERGDKLLAPKSPTASQQGKLQLEAALTEAINYGQFICDEYKNDSREEVQILFKKTFRILAWDQPIHREEAVATFVSKETRVTLANELNQAILESQCRLADV
ncbi:CTLH/CRA C-terminal to lish motif domain-containing protein [Coprinopsis sp. MPI-PUGE-AT-0042]|nr:CTLH/CRA C-terminal to lish motif domain-containing protein [Coprinopsis sp. MPI-PUGE-AT-0042]